jgi:hypothetical protein
MSAATPKTWRITGSSRGPERVLPRDSLDGRSLGTTVREDVAAKLGRKTSEVSVIRQRLREKGLVYATEDYGYVDSPSRASGSSWLATCRVDHRAAARPSN